MPHEIYDSKFVSYRKPVWHRLGTVVEEPISAVEGWQMMGPYQVALRSMLVEADPSMPYLGDRFRETGKKGIFRLDDLGRPDELFAVVGDTYQIIAPEEFPAIWDMATEENVETMFVLRGGRIMGITTRIDAVDIEGDEVERYVMALNAFDGSTANRFVVTPVRVVCQNTLETGLNAAITEVRLNHDSPNFRAEFFTALREGLATAREKANALQEAMEILARTPIRDADAQDVVVKTYPLPSRPRQYDWKQGTDAWESRMVQWETSKATQEAAREQVMGLYQGDSDTHTAATTGTAWGIYNMVAEFEDHVREGKNQASSAEAALFGYRAQAKKRAFKLAMELAR